MQEGESKGFAELPIDEVKMAGDICIKANKFEENLCQILKTVKDGKESVSMDSLLKFHEEGK